MRIERISGEHMSGLAALETACFSEPWSENALSSLYERGMGAGFAVIEDGKVVAYAGALFVLDEAQIANVATLPEYRGKGYARAALCALIDYAREGETRTMTLEVRRSNTPAISLYESLGFRVVGERPRFYRAPVEDALLMELSI